MKLLRFVTLPFPFGKLALSVVSLSLRLSDANRFEILVSGDCFTKVTGAGTDNRFSFDRCCLDMLMVLIIGLIGDTSLDLLISFRSSES